MSYKDDKLGYPMDLLKSRAIINNPHFALIPQEGLVKNIIPGFENCEMTILGSPKLGATFVDYLCTMQRNAKNSTGFGGNGLETFVYVIEGCIKASDGKQTYILEKGGFLFVSDQDKMFLENRMDGSSELFLYKRRYKKIEGFQAYTVAGNINQIQPEDYENMKNVKIYNLLPTSLDFDMNFHILAFDAGASHGYIETHVQEHGALILSGQGMYNLDNQWIPVKKDDYIFMGAYCPQAAYGISSNECFSYLYSKDCNRDEII